jgi:hypothetical protein
MKIFNVFIISALALTLFACKGGVKNDIVGAWGVEEVDMSALLAGIPEEEKAMAEAFMPMMEEAMKSMEMTFEKEGKFTMKASMMGQDQNEEGTWSLSDDGKVLTTKTSEGPESKMNIESMSGNKMVVNSDMDGQTVKMTFVKK